MPPSRDIAALAEAVADREAIDWASIREHLTEPSDHSVATELHTLSQLGTIEQPELRSAKRLPFVLETMRPLAIGAAVIGASIEIVGAAFFGRVDHLTFAAMILAFGGAALYLDVGGTDRRARALALCYWMVAASFSTSAFRWMSRQLADPAWLHVITGIRPEAFFAAALWQFTREFPTVTRFSRLDRVCTVALGLTSAIGVALFGANLALAVAPQSDFASVAAPFDSVTAQPWFWNLVFGSAFPALVTMRLRARNAQTMEGRRARLFLRAIYWSFVPVVLIVLGEGLVPSFRQLTRTPTGQLVGSIVIYLPQFSLPVVTAYAVVVDNVLDVRVLVQRGLRYLVTRAVIAWGATLPFAGLLLYAFRHRNEPMAAALSAVEARPLIWACSAAVVLLLIRPWLVRALDRWALPGMEDGATVLAQLADRLTNTRTPGEIAGVFAEAIESALQAPTSVYVKRGDALVGNPADIPLPDKSFISVMLEGARTPCLVAPTASGSYFPLLSQDDRRWIREQQVAVLVPVMSGSDRPRLAGVVTIKHRRNALSFSASDFRFLRASLASASLAAARIEAESETSFASSAEVIEEFAIECTGCGRVNSESRGNVICDCGGHWRRSALPERVLQRFELTQRLGAGGMGIVYRAKDSFLHRDVAIKTVTRLSEDVAERLIVEARTMAALSHGNMAVLYSAEIWRGTPLLVMEYLVGGTLAARLRKGPLQFEETLRLATVLGAALDHLHGRQLYHGDIKPSNIGFTADGSPKFLDFGLSRATAKAIPSIEGHAAAPLRPVFAGTLPYLSPEVRNGTAPGPALDLWALTIVLCECLLATHPFATARTSDEIARGVTGLVTQMRTAFPSRLGDFIARALSLDHDKRYPLTAAEFVEELSRLSRGADPDRKESRF
jgi:hypothetical protein